MRHVELEDVMHPLPDLELDRTARGEGAPRVLPRVVQQPLVRPNLDQVGRQAREIAEQRRAPGVSGIIAA